MVTDTADSYPFIYIVTACFFVFFLRVGTAHFTPLGSTFGRCALQALRWAQPSVRCHYIRRWPLSVFRALQRPSLLLYTPLSTTSSRQEP